MSQTHPRLMPLPPSVTPEPGVDRFMRRLLRVGSVNSGLQRSTEAASAQRAFSKSIVISGIRCLLTYLVIPLLGPTMGIFGSASRPIVSLLCMAGIYTSITSMRKFWLSNHRYRWAYTAFASIILIYLAASLIGDAFYYLS